MKEENKRTRKIILIYYYVFIYLLLEDMEKLVELLNEFDGYWDYNGDYGPYMLGMDSDAYWYHKYYLISKEYGFIERLVKNDKIDFELPIETLSFREYYDIKKSDFLIMILSIQDNPLEYLCSILKE